MANSFRVIAKIPVNLEKSSIKLYLISKATFMQKGGSNYTGQIDIGLSLKYDINTSKITKHKGLIKRRQTIIN